ncbi:helix-turn-helix domain-containing protein [Sutcliffiella cohnii]|uniref:AraC family transcriptional regulator n=1 Tax=Sutcliffiella cohnii TaxID=33932 RepID=A0A223KNB0_9BACI|nr:AraC family transcriptional regulator [Sutcliffiella cohnii]AST90971.1 AraC family transcriptional regulator [Sutcliffiella cohnii]MED4017689.1 AraC family transcriptional regulator [Sutcliffiella cohnii]
MTNEKTKIIIQAIEYMKEHLDKEITSEGIALHVGYSPYHFSRVFKEVTGIPPRHYLSALRIEAGKQRLVNSSDSILKAVLKAGFRSTGTFSSKFKQFVGLSPKQFQKNIEPLHRFVHDYDSSTILQPLEALAPSVTCEVKAPPDFKGIIFVGLFPRPIPDQAPVVGTAFDYRESICTFSNVPKGKYYVLSAAIAKGVNPKHYFVLSHALRGIAENTVDTQLHSTSFTEVVLREPLPYDPPILINLPKLLFDTKKRKQEEN